MENVSGRYVETGLEISKIKGKRTKRETVALVQIKHKCKQNNMGTTNAEEQGQERNREEPIRG